MTMEAEAGAVRTVGVLNRTKAVIGLLISLFRPSHLSLLLPMSLPLEVFENIVFLIATEDTSTERLSNLVPLLLLDRKTSNFLSFHSNHSLYARIYATKFDIKTTTRRLGKERLTARGLAEELKKRCVHLRAIRTLSPEFEPAIWTAFVMMLENDGKNERLLLEQAQITCWLKHYWVTISNALDGEGWPSNSLFHSICMWLLCNFYPKGERRSFDNHLPRECSNTHLSRGLWTSHVEDPRERDEAILRRSTLLPHRSPFLDGLHPTRKCRRPTLLQNDPLRRTGEVNPPSHRDSGNDILPRDCRNAREKERTVYHRKKSRGYRVEQGVWSHQQRPVQSPYDG